MDLAATRLSVIDMQHRRIETCFHKLNSIPVESWSQVYTRAVLEDLQQHLIDHFETEERVMRVCRYPDIERHRRLHQYLLFRLMQLITSYEHSSHGPNEDELEQLHHRLEQHLKNEDVKLYRYIQDF